ncbi:alcohol dehydrogenase catalytic domain-containing protein, partial [Streptomyces sp. NPDC059152]|uniref:alcohol dehydrogenase catalytic domain-containing protein n=1 Tax=Streptomyces sp. NPDC059152 TaxID=3346742 RepID=UPI00368A5B8F
MKAWRVHANGEPQAVMRLEEVPDPQPGPGRLLLRVRAANVNFPDALLCRGQYQVRPPLPFTPGVEICGEVLAVGEGAAGEVGARVLAQPALPGGGFAELAVADAATVRPAPEALDDAEAAALHIGYQTGWFGLHRRGRRPGGRGGVGGPAPPGGGAGAPRGRAGGRARARPA